MDDESKAVCSIFIKELATSIRDISATLHRLTEEAHEHSVAIGTTRVQLDSALESIKKLNEAVREGNGTPPLITRMAVVEEHIKNYDDQKVKTEAIAAKAQTQEDDSRRVQKQFRLAMIVAVISGVLGMMQGIWAMFHK